MAKYIAKRIVTAIPLLLAISILCFIMMSAAPYNAVDSMIKPGMSEEVMELMRAKYGYDQPAYVLAIVLGLVAGSHKNKWQDKLIDGFASIGIATPTFWVSMLFLYFFGYKLRLLPIIGMHTIGMEASLIDFLKHFVLPYTVLVIAFMPDLIRYVRSSTITQFSEDYVMVQKAFGASRTEIMFKHVCKNVLLPVITKLGMAMPMLITGAIITETIFSWPGIGPYFTTAVDGVTFDIRHGEAFGLVGESGCGKSTLGCTLIRMYEPTDGQILFDGEDITHKKKKEIFPYHKRMQIIFQDPYSALDPHQNVREIMEEPLRMNTEMSRKDRLDRIKELLEKVGLQQDALEKYAYEFSGGQRQRIGIARALSVNPEFIMCDEPISALDVSIQAQVVNMLEDLQQEFGLTYLFVSHDLSMVRHISNRIGVMYLGNIVEIVENDELYDHPLHPYTQALLSAIPIADPDRAADSKRQIISGDLPSPMNVLQGCRFHTRCPYAAEKCRTECPQMKQVSSGHQMACHLV